MTMGVRKQKNLIEKATEVADQVLPQVESAFDHAVERAQEGIHQAAPLVAQGKATAGEKLAKGKVAAGEKITKGTVAAAPLVAQGKEAASGALAHALDVAAHAAESTQHFAEEHAAALKEEPAKKKGGKLRKFLLFSGLIAVVGVIAKKLSDGREAAKWQSATSPTPPAPRASSKPPAPTQPADDAAGADPAEALSDATDTPHAVTTPDNPADEVEVPAGPQEVAPKSAEAHEDLEDIAAEDEADNGQGNEGRV